MRPRSHPPSQHQRLPLLPEGHRGRQPVCRGAAGWCTQPLGGAPPARRPPPLRRLGGWAFARPAAGPALLPAPPAHHRADGPRLQLEQHQPRAVLRLHHHRRRGCARAALQPPRARPGLVSPPAGRPAPVGGAAISAPGSGCRPPAAAPRPDACPAAYANADEDVQDAMTNKDCMVRGRERRAGRWAGRAPASPALTRTPRRAGWRTASCLAANKNVCLSPHDPAAALRLHRGPVLRRDGAQLAGHDRGLQRGV